MKKPVLIIMAAGMGSRYGGLKQIDPVDEQGHIIMDFSLYDAVKAGLLLLSMRTIITEEALFPKFMIILPLTEAAKLAKRASMIIPW